jgi:16S rRNA processing protein RimM
VVENNGKNNSINTGLPNRGEPVFLAIGILRKLHGIKGEMVLELLTDFPERVTKGKKVYLGEGYDFAMIKSVRKSNKGLLIQFDHVELPEEAQELRNLVVYILTNEIPDLPSGKFYHHQVVGLSVFRDDKTRLGIVSDIITTGSNDVYVVKPDDENEQEILLPAINSVILDIDLKNGIMVVNPPVWR